MSKVVIARGEDIAKRTFCALKELSPKFEENAKILIKPNLVEPMPNDSGAITRKETIEGIIQFFSEHEIVIGEGAGIFDTEKCFEKAGYYELERKYGVKLIDLHKTSFTKIKGKYWEFEVSKIAKECSLISAAVLKEHAFQVTLTLKNLMGVLKPQKEYPTKNYMHEDCNAETWTKRLCDLIRAVKPRLGIIDATTAMYGSHLFGKLKKLDLTLASNDCLACDILGSKILGHEKVFYLETALKENLGNFPSEIKELRS